MRTNTIGLLATLACTLPAAVTLPSYAATSASASSVASSALRPVAVTSAAAPPTKRVSRAYGDGPVRQDLLRQPIVIRFHGHRGDRVGVVDSAHKGDQTVGLRLPSGAVTSRRVAGYFRLPETGTYRLAWRNPRATKALVSVQLTKLRVYDAALDVAPAPLEAERGYGYAARVRAPASGRITVRAGLGRTSQVRAMVDPNGDVVFDSYADAVQLEAGHRLLLRGFTSWFRGAPPHRRTEAGDRYLVYPQRPTDPISVSRTLVAKASIDGGPAGLPAPGPVLGAGYEVRFDATAGSWLHPTLTAGSVPQTSGMTLLTPGGRPLLENSIQDLWRLPTTGTYRLLVVPDRPDEALGGAVSLDGVTMEGPVPSDGTPVTVASTTPGRWTVAPVVAPADYTLLTMTVDQVTLGGDWVVYVGGPEYPRCAPRGPLSCGDNVISSVSRAYPGPSAPVYGGWVVLPVEADRTGSVRVRVAPTS